MPWERGEGSVEVELANIQSWVERIDVELNGKNGGDGVIREWHDFKAARKAYERYMRFTMAGLALMIAVPAALVALSALGFIHLK